MPLRAAIARFVRDGAVIGIGGQNIGRCAMAAAHEIVRQQHRGLTLVGCNLSIHADLLIGAELVRHCECGTGNVETFGIAYRFSHAIQHGLMTVTDYDHGSMLSRFVAAGMGIPFMPIRNLWGSDLVGNGSRSTTAAATLRNPWPPYDDVLAVPALSPDVAIVHAQEADTTGNVVIRGPASHDPELIRASRASIVTVERLLPAGSVDHCTSGTVVPHHFVSAVVHEPWGAWPTSVFGEYHHDSDHLTLYQNCAREGGAPYMQYLDTFVRGTPDFRSFLVKAQSGSQ